MPEQGPQALTIPRYACRHVAHELPIDGTLDHPAWARADVATLVDVRDGAPARQATTARALWSDTRLYVAFDCIDSDAWGTLMRRDDPVCEEEAVEVFINPSGDLRAYYEFEVSPRNTVYDLFVLNPGDRRGAKFLSQWDSDGLVTAVVVRGDATRRTGDDRGWTATLAIPLCELITAPNLPPLPGDRWRWNLYRIDRAADGDEYQAWSPTGAVDFHRPDKFGALEFVRDDE